MKRRSRRNYLPLTARYSYSKDYIQCSGLPAAQQAHWPCPFPRLIHSRVQSPWGQVLRLRSRRLLSDQGVSWISRRQECWPSVFLAARYVLVRLHTYKCDLRKGGVVWHTSLLPRPKPLITGPDNRMGNGAIGPASGPATGSRGLSGLIAKTL
jgi:hypothetical protein